MDEIDRRIESALAGAQLEVDRALAETKKNATGVRRLPLVPALKRSFEREGLAVVEKATIEGLRRQLEGERESMRLLMVEGKQPW